jgi:plastocyanin
MRTREFHALIVVSGAVAAMAMSPLVAAAQSMGRAMMPRAPAAAMQNPRPNMGMNMAGFQQSAGGFGHMPFGMMSSYSGMHGQGGYGMGSMGPYGMGSMGSYGGGMMGSPYAQQMGGYGAAGPAEDRSLSRVLKAVGLPHEDGHLEWPVGLRSLAATQDLVLQIDTLVQEEAEQAQAGPANAQLDKELARAVDALRTQLLRDKEERFSLPLTAYEDAERFLAKLGRAQQMLKAGVEPSADKARLETREGAEKVVSITDDRFSAPTLEVAAGTTVHWTNTGQHRHTVTSDKGDWGSKELAPGAVYSYTFSQPGTYPYHCEVHPKEMRGSVVVK